MEFWGGGKRKENESRQCQNTLYLCRLRIRHVLKTVEKQGVGGKE
jgi:hypothetical protein